jgi:hypothetical protein
MTAISRDQAPIEFEADFADARTIEAGGMTIAFERMNAGLATAEVFAGLPDDACQSPHWGYAIKGRFRVQYTDGTQDTIAAGQAYYLPPGHNVVFEEDALVVEFSPTEARGQTMEHVARKMAAGAV